MKTALIMRHAKSSWKEPHQEDHQRPLNKRGRRDAPRMAEQIEKNGLVPQHLASSTAQRTRETAQLLLDSWSGHPAPSVEFLDDLYLAPTAVLLQCLAEMPDSATCAMVLAHNPGMENLVGHLCGDMHHFPTAAVAVFRWETDNWDEVASVTATLQALWIPKAID